MRAPVRCAAQVLMTQLAAKEQGYNDVVYLDAKTDTFLEEVSSCNIFTVSGRTIRTPPLQARWPPLHPAVLGGGLGESVIV